MSEHGTDWAETVLSFKVSKRKTAINLNNGGGVKCEVKLCKILLGNRKLGTVTIMFSYLKGEKIGKI